ncbi:MAG: phosphatase PAP2 family protein [Fulvivirga sp.]|nr:phosphatase PAP2 family protein [Fulvivirga sp.]
MNAYYIKLRDFNRKWLLLLIVLFAAWSLPAYAQDSLRTELKWYETKSVRNFAAPVALTALGLYVHQQDALINRFEVQENITRRHPGFESNLDDFLRYIPPATVFFLDAIGQRGKHKASRQALFFVKANIIAMALVFPLKGITKVRRPDDSSSASFPSLHTAQAFLGATFLHKEFGHLSPWYSIGGYAMAALTGYYRMLNNKHWFSDVLVGAAAGILSTNLAYLIKRKNKKLSERKWLIVPTYNHGPALTMHLKL